MNDEWKKELRENIRSISEVNSYFSLNLPESFPYDINIPKEIASKIKNGSEVLRAQFLPNLNELKDQEEGLYDPIGDLENSKSSGIVHRYHNRILFFPTTTCPIICRYCFRKNELSQSDSVLKGRINFLNKYLENNSEINEVILSGGDPLVLSDQQLKKVLDVIKEHSHIKYLRFHSRTPVSLPSRINNDFVNLIQGYQKYFQVIFVIHINHKQEITSKVKKAFQKLNKFRLFSQTVLLKNVNDDAKILKELFYTLNDNNILPYYLHHPDKVRGGMHFSLSTDDGKSIMKQLRMQIPGWLIPKYIIDHPSGKSVIS